MIIGVSNAFLSCELRWNETMEEEIIEINKK